MDTPRCALDKKNPLSRIGEGQISVGSSLTSSSPIQDLFLICENPDAKVSDCWTEQGWNSSDSLLIGYFTSLYGVCTLEKTSCRSFLVIKNNPCRRSIVSG
ncbi:hypothetical protein H5410_012948 [Solanum commersonii]|uniref:Uncharacterized protein n=1 Tax=Solanum commersonii TaxID=4109 RepID=A0A9J6AU38_SOLCO|nr:hypothetical protein H5410_012948 [Solanum commersonii]